MNADEKERGEGGMSENQPRVKMTYEEAVARIPRRKLPGFWVSTVERVVKEVGKVRVGKVREIGASAGGRALYAVSYGEPDAPPKANYNSAVAAREPARYFDKAGREKPVLMIVGPVHGHEVEGLTGVMNFISVLETGKDLAGTERAGLGELARRCRLVIIPVGNPDGVARFELGALNGMELEDIQFWGQGTWKDDTLCKWPGCKRLHPKTGEEVGWLGCYFNDDGINPMHDEFFAPMATEAPAILKEAQRWGPDIVTLLHSHSHPPTLLRPEFAPVEAQEEAIRIGLALHEKLTARGLPCDKPYWEPGPYSKTKNDCLNLGGAIHHTSGATTFTFECPHGIKGDCTVSMEQILEIQMMLYEVLMESALKRQCQA